MILGGGDETAGSLGVYEFASRHTYSGGSILRIIEHAAIWAAARRVVDKLPFGLVAVALAVVAVVALAGRYRARKSRGVRQW